jgi:gamma-glutamylcyclotransferase (GGCT)/AIG2-like uncharacterized protein YtfP
VSPPLPLFVYGTLMTGASQAGLLAGLGRTTAMVRGSLWSLPAGYPALCLEGDDRVHGELVDPPSPRLLELLDRYEGVDEGLYRRVRVEVIVGLRPGTAWAWVMDAPRLHGGRAIPEGRWRAVRRR